MLRPTRRGVLAMASAGLLIPRSILAASAGTSKRKFLFVFANGGWDTTYVFAPMAGSASVDTEPDATTATFDDITIVDHEERPSVRSFFERYSSRTCVVNGMEVPSITHDRCRRILMTGRATDNDDDWAALLASEADDDTPMPYVVFSGPAMTQNTSWMVVRLGPTGQLENLLDGTAVSVDSDLPATLPSDSAAALQDAYVRQRIADFTSRSSRGRSAQFGDRYSTMLDRRDILVARGGLPEGGPGNEGLAATLSLAADCLETGLSRCAIVSHDGVWSSYWDSHSQISMQSLHYEELFGYLNELMDDLDSRPGEAGGTLADETTVVVCSEMGRTPKLNSSGGKDHWTYTSFMLVGSGVRGGQVVGAFDDDLVGRAVDLSSGELSDTGTYMDTNNFGATILALGDVDPGPVCGDCEPIAAAMSD